MIVDTIRNAEKYYAAIPHMKEGFECMLAHVEDEPYEGRVDFDGGYILLQKGLTKPIDGGLFEAHRKYLDVQVLLEGTEIIVYSDIETLTPQEPYNPERDREMFSGTGACHEIKPGTFCILFPEDGHMACRDNGTRADYKKVVIKLLIE